MKRILKSFQFFVNTIIISILMVAAFVSMVLIIVPDIINKLDSETLTSSIIGALMITIISIFIFGIIVKKSNAGGIISIAWLSLSFYGLQTLIGHIDAVVFYSPLGKYIGSGSLIQSSIPLSWLLYSFVIGIPVAIIIVPLTFLLHGKIKMDKTIQKSIIWPKMDKKQWLQKIAAIIIIYESIYFLFGYFIAWQNPEVREFYQGIDHGSFFAQMKFIISETPLLIVVQVFRSILWIIIVLPVISIFKDRVKLGALLTAALLAAPWINIFIFMPGLVPVEVGMTHLIEVTISNFIFGFILFWLLHRRHESLTDLFAIKAK